MIAATTVLTGGVWAGALFSNTDNQVVGALAMSFTFLWFGIVLMIGAIMLESLASAAFRWAATANARPWRSSIETRDIH